MFPSRSTILFTLTCTVAVFLWTQVALSFPYPYPKLPTPMSQMSSPHANWYSRSTPLTEVWTPTAEKLLFGLFLNAPADPEGFICALFEPNIVVDSMGKTLKVPQEDFDAIVTLASRSSDLPDTGSFRNAWRIRHPITSKPIQILRYKQTDGSLKETSVYGYSKDINILEEHTQGFTTLPDVLMELFGLLNEPRTGYQKGEEDISMIAKIKQIL
ncbi:hypothetical protein M422DRAFT_29576 [Sphaerobolus stellatus SS14]|uniref:Uncharacterized protein n=1 Tax=Sphaerobolus stellatus (strain SS14) TaxID=990650 RepID=A0A0C9VTM9_SPHS4|nr:hypothetical protein M422DRAFT_29576 [Sphaerobolus stellatus SS14]